ncbi:hypothetical protein JI735_25885 [Paenibacillus sonchi]|uniref:Uncharacterized protein n=1 Tax=Paenibacillus sonchi TaxID=373687 RepID=A0A974SC88_9BACL|nr:hypothetical protein [Paenibacillus sonchi]QQZ59966.1 hypothetical protein JI735_25885 [Paenibacillus sonchi]
MSVVNEQGELLQANSNVVIVRSGDSLPGARRCIQPQNIPLRRKLVVS